MSISPYTWRRSDMKALDRLLLLAAGLAGASELLAMAVAVALPMIGSSL
jgi:hypothetical protein